MPEEERIPEDTFPAQETVSNEDSTGTEKFPPDATLEASQAEVVIEDLDDAQEHTLNEHDNIPYGLDDRYEPTSELDVAPMPNAPAEDAVFVVPSPGSPLIAVRDDLNFSPPPPLAPSSTVTSVFEATAPEAPTEDTHTITFKILNGVKVLRSLVFIKACTQTAILEEARAYCMKFAQDDQSLGTKLTKGYKLALTSLKIVWPGHGLVDIQGRKPVLPGSDCRENKYPEIYAPDLWDLKGIKVKLFY